MKPKPPPPKNNLAALQMAIDERDDILAQLATLKEREMVLRKFIAAQLFPRPKEGTNRVTTCGIEAKLDYKLTRKVLLPELDALRPDLLKRGVPVNRLVEMDPKLVLKEYRELSEPHRRLFDRVLEIKASDTPSITINGL